MIEERLKELNIALMEDTAPVANYLSYKISGNTVYVSGKLPKTESGLITGKLGANLTVEEGYAAARIVGINLISALKSAAGGDLDRIASIVKVLGFVACAPGFVDAPKVINGCSDLLVEVFKESGKHARSAVSTHQLPLDVPVEIELIAELK